ncbi:hypothetical protein HYALB_00006130 [Hymenoscyphus albidus]|uniref:Uncharacterized protein n=1 Tax=Hymenoscyphus albidus TaxID=595503 RepID=A0A9N9LPS1_9HELO|nr:hypothetical protein HYALB_00006130 [Hymenoscyphus albidus]
MGKTIRYRGEVADQACRHIYLPVLAQKHSTAKQGKHKTPSEKEGRAEKETRTPRPVRLSPENLICIPILVLD